jgi:hypothetical protein
MKNIKDFKEFTINESEDAPFIKRKVKDEHAAEDHLENEGVMWTDFDFNHPDGVGFKDGDNTVAHYDKNDGHLHIYADPADSFGQDEVSKMDNEVKDKDNSMKKYYKEDGEGDGSDTSDTEEYDEEGNYIGSADDADDDWENENSWQLEDLPFDDEV